MEKAYIYCLKFVLPYSNNATKVCIDVNVLSSNLIHLQNKLLLIAHTITRSTLSVSLNTKQSIHHRLVVNTCQNHHACDCKNKAYTSAVCYSKMSAKQHC